MSQLAAWRALYPFESRFLALEGACLHYLDEGSGAPLLFVHGNPTWSFYWRNLIVPLRKRYRCVAVDHVGCGLSDKPSPASYSYTLSRHVANLTAVVDALDLSRITLVAHDWGGAIGLGAALNRPERFSRLVLFNTGAFPPPFIPLRIRLCRTPLLGRLALQGLNLFARAALRMAVERPARLTAEIRAGLLAPYDSWAHRPAIYQFVKDIPGSPRHPTWSVLERIESELPSLADRPALFVWGMRDWCFRQECLERLLVSLPRAETHRFAEAGHYVVEEEHEQIVPILEDFLRRTD